MKSSKVTFLTFFILISGCAQYTRDTNKGMDVPTPSIASTNNLAHYAIKDEITGRGCASKTFWFIDTSFNEGYSNFKAAEDAESVTVARAKAAASYDALHKEKKPSQDLLVYPVWNITRETDFFGFHERTCAEVQAYKAHITVFTDSGTITDPANDKKDVKKSFWPF